MYRSKNNYKRRHIIKQIIPKNMILAPNSDPQTHITLNQLLTKPKNTLPLHTKTTVQMKLQPLFVDLNSRRHLICQNFYVYYKNLFARTYLSYYNAK